ADRLLAEIGCPAHSYLWGSNGENPYAAYLALADEIVVTTDSISMVHEASLTGRPLHLFELPASGRLLARAAYRIDRGARAARAPVRRRYLDLIRNGWLAPPRHVAAFHDRLLSSGQAAPLGAAVAPRAVRPDASDADRAAEAVRGLFGAAAPVRHR
ncbi:MAG TPA: ELM1/GtrOC1 family putative glycosyltransferase, partial [Thermohalobaculum sp.]|nr:ELM1/GtrOC1 family putative glycosyltransferase [Thermohalobaculum sp.]